MGGRPIEKKLRMGGKTEEKMIECSTAGSRMWDREILAPSEGRRGTHCRRRH